MVCREDCEGVASNEKGDKSEVLLDFASLGQANKSRNARVTSDEDGREAESGARQGRNVQGVWGMREEGCDAQGPEAKA